jgi:hypothetical protein
MPAALSTPRAVQRFLHGLPYNFEPDGPTLRTLRGVLRHRTAHCLEAALSAAALLEPHGYPPLLLDLRSKDKLDHVVFLFEADGRFGSVARSRDPGLQGRRPVFASVEALVRSYVLPFIDLTGRVTGFAVYDLRELARCDWRASLRNVWAVERALIANRGQRLRTSDREYERWHARYVAFRARHPDVRPAYYPRRDTWW